MKSKPMKNHEWKWGDGRVLSHRKSASQRVVIQMLEYSNLRKTMRRKVASTQEESEA